MLDQFLEVAYTRDVEKRANAALEAKLRTMPINVVEKVAFGLSAKACGGFPGSSADGEAKTWLDLFKGSPLFEKAVELERAEIALSQQDLERRMSEQAQDTWTKRDAIRLEKQMLELDLAVESVGGASGAGANEAADHGPESKEEQGVEMLEQSQAEERAAGEGGEPAELKEDAAIEQFRKAQSDEEKAKAQPPKAPPGAAQAPPSAKPKPEAEVKVAAAVAAGRILAKLAEANPEGHKIRRALLGNPMSTAIETEPGSRLSQGGKALDHAVGATLKGLGKGSLVGGALGALGGAAVGAAEHGRNGILAGAGKGALVGAQGGGAIGGIYGRIKGNLGEEASRIHGEKSKHAPGGSQSPEVQRSARDKEVVDESSYMPREDIANEAQHYRESADDIDANPGKYRLRRALAGGIAGGLGGGALGGALGGHAGKGALLGAGAGALMSALPKPDGAGFRGDAAALDSHLAKSAGLGGGLGGVVSGIGGAAKGLGSLASTAFKSGGVPQVAKSLGNVATGFAKANPLAAAGAAAGAGVLAGRALAPKQPQVVR